MVTTRNEAIDELSLGSSIGSLPLKEELQGVRLRFGEISSGGRDGARHGVGRLGFGLDGEVQEIEKFGKYC
jgi:hypothetical protein